MKKLTHIAIVGALLNALMLNNAQADDWGCEVLLCLSNPQGATAVAQCVPPIKKLWRELSKGRPFPACFMGGGKDSNGNGAQHRWASVGYCPQEYLVPPRDAEDQWTCALSGAVTVVIDNQPVTRVWWGGESSFTEPLTGGSPGSAPNSNFGNEVR